jgi:hypothetical protein
MSRFQFAAMTAVMGVMSLVGAFAAVAVFVDSKPVQADGEDKVIQATEFQLVDGQGKARGVWGVTDEGMALFSLLDPKGKPRLSMATDKKSGTVITLTDSDGTQRMTQAVNAEGMAVITYYHPDGKTQAFQVSTSGEGESSLILYDKTKKNSILASVLADGRSVIAMESNEVTRFRAMLGKNGEPEMGFIEKGDKGLRYTWQAGGK